MIVSVLLAALGCRNDTELPTEGTTAAPVSGPEVAITSNTWITRKDLWSAQYSDFATAVVPNASGQSVLYVIGGRSAARNSLGKVMAYNVATNTWSAKASLPLPLFNTNGAAVIGGKIYISGGMPNSQNFSDRLYVYDPATNTWTERAPMPYNGAVGLTGVIDNKLYVVTTCFDHDHCNRDPEGRWGPWLFRYDPRTDAWTELAVPPDMANEGTGGGTIGGRLYMACPDYACEDNSALHVYDPATDTWSRQLTNRNARIGAAFVTSGAKLYMIGGYRINADRTRTPLARTDVYDPTTNTWTSRAPLPTARGNGSAARIVVGGRPRIEFVGGPRPGNNVQYIP
jgi:N-acetylneuraminic acid mutarotase